MSAKKSNQTQAADNGPSITKPMRTRTYFSIALIFVCMALLCGQLFRIQVLEQDYWQKQAVAQQLSDVQISANRGQIYDANMSVLALTREVCTIVMAPCNIRREVTRQKIADELSVMLEVDRSTLYQQTLDSESQYKVVKSKVDKSVGDTFIAWVNENSLGGVFRIVTDYKREYPLKNTLSTVLGFVGKDNVAREGLELKYDAMLSGTPGRMVAAQNTYGDHLPTSLQYEYTVDAVDGNSLVLTVDQYVQQVTDKYLAEAIEEYGARNRGCAIVMDVDTCAILAMSTKGDYDPNDYLTIADPKTAEKIALLSGEEQSAAIVKARLEQYRNKALDFYEPGSVFKIFTASMGLEEGLVTEESPFYCGGSFSIADRNMKCWVHPKGHGQQNFITAIANSCNPAFMTLGTRIGTRLFSKYYAGFGFTAKTEADLLGEQDVTSGLYHLPESITQVDVAASSIGQTFKVTPLQMITGISAVANGGYLMQPYIVKQVVDSEGNVIANTEPMVKRQMISESTSDRLCAMLENAVSSGKIANAYISGYRVGGKTGTSEKTETKSEEDEDQNVQVIASFGGIAPADDPQVAVLVMVDEPQRSKSGSAVAAPIARKILKDILPYLGVEPNYTAEEIAGLDRTVPNVVGATVSAAQTTLKASTLTAQTIGNGSTVIKQVPASGTSVPKGGTVWLYTDNRETQTTTVPDFTGMSVAQTTQAARAAGINVLLSGISTTDGTPAATRQSVKAGETVAKGTVVTVEFTYTANIY